MNRQTKQNCISDGRELMNLGWR